MTKFKISQSLLRSLLAPLTHIASTSTKLPIMKNVYLKISKDSIILKATNLTIGLVQEATEITDFSGDNAEILVLAKPFLEIVNISPKGEIEFSINEGCMEIITKQARTIFQTSNIKQFPILPDLDTKKAQKITITTEKLKDLVTKTLFARSSDTTRPIINGIYFSTHNTKLYAAATDGYRLSDFLIGDCKDDIKIIVPASFLLELSSVVGDKTGQITIFVNEEGIKAEFGDATLFSYIIDGKYPDYKALIPEKNNITLVLDKNELTQAVRATQVFAREIHSIVVIKTNSKKNQITLSSIANEYGENISTISTKVSADTEITLNSRYIIDGASSIDSDRVILGLDDASHPAIMKQAKDDDSFVHLIMPIRS